MNNKSIRPYRLKEGDIIRVSYQEIINPRLGTYYTYRNDINKFMPATPVSSPPGCSCKFYLIEYKKKWWHLWIFKKYIKIDLKVLEVNKYE
jgi:hypothetical protein